MPKDTTVKITVETKQNLECIQEILVKRGLRILPEEFHDIIKSIDSSVTHKLTVAIAVQFLKNLVIQIDEAHNKAEEAHIKSTK